MRARKVGLVIVAAALGTAALGLTFAAYLNPSIAMDLGSVMTFCAQWVGLR